MRVHAGACWTRAPCPHRTGQGSGVETPGVSKNEGTTKGICRDVYFRNDSRKADPQRLPGPDLTHLGLPPPLAMEMSG